MGSVLFDRMQESTPEPLQACLRPPAKSKPARNRHHYGVAGVIGGFFTVVEVAKISGPLTLGKSMGVSARIAWGF